MSVTYTRESEKVRRQAFVDATIECLAEFGYHGTSVRRIADKAGVAAGLLTHYFAGKEELIAAAYQQLSDATFDHAIAAAERAGDDPCLRFRAFITAGFFGPELPFNILKVWINFWALTLTEPRIRVAHAETYGRYRNQLALLIEQLLTSSGQSCSRADIEALAIGTNAVTDGLWLEYSLDPDTFDAEQAVQIACRFVGRGLGIDLGSSRSVSARMFQQKPSIRNESS